MVSGLKLWWWEYSMTFTSKLNKHWRSCCSLVCYLPHHCSAFPPPLVRAHVLHSDWNGTACMFRSWSLLPRISTSAFSSSKMLILLLLQGTRPVCLTLFGQCSCPGRLLVQGRFACANHTWIKNVHHFRKHKSRKWTWISLKWRLIYKLNRIVYLEDELTNVTQNTSRD